MLRLSINAEYDFRPNLIANKFTKKLNVKVDITQTYIIDGSTNRWTRLYIGLGYHKICIWNCCYAEPNSDEEKELKLSRFWNIPILKINFASLNKFVPDIWIKLDMTTKGFLGVQKNPSHVKYV